MSGRRAAFRVALKNSRRNKKRTAYLVLLIAIPVMVAVMTSVSVNASHITPEERATSDFGQANVRMDRWGADTTGVDAWIEERVAELAPDANRLSYRSDHVSFAPRFFGAVVDLDLDNPLSDGILGLVAGRSPSAPGEVVLTEHLAATLEAGIGDTVVLDPSDDREYEIVGLASHPLYWARAEAVVTPEGMDQRLSGRGADVGGLLMLEVDDDLAFSTEFSAAWERDKYDFYPEDREWPMPERYWFMWEGYYAAMSDAQLSELDRIIEEEGEEAAMGYPNALFPNGVSLDLPEVYLESRTERLMWNTTNIVESGPVIGTGVAAVILAEVAFIAGAAFATGTRRRLREIGLLGANGASHKHVRSTVVAEGLVVGLVGGVVGSLIAFVLVLLGRSTLQQFVERRIDGFPFGLMDIAGPVVVAVVACVIAAWVPARTASGVPTLTALQGRMPVGAPKRWVVPLGLSLAAFGILLLGVGLAGGHAGAGAVAVIGAVLMIGGAALLAGPLVAWISKHADRFPITSRIVLRDSGRQRGRAAAAVAATMVILMAPLGVLTTLEQNAASGAINGLPLEQPQVLVSGTYTDEGETVPLSEENVEEIESMLPDARIVSFETVDVPIKYPTEVQALSSEDSVGEGQYYLSPWRMSVANDELLGLLGDRRLEAALESDGIGLIGVEERESAIEIGGETISVAEVPIAVQEWSFPRVVVTAERAAEFAQFESRDQLIVEVDQSWFDAINPFQNALDPLWENDLSLELSGGGDDVSPEMIFALVFLATMLIVLIVVATITALSAAEADSDLRTVVAVGATNSIRRRYLGLQSGIHTLLGCLLAIPLTLLLMRTAYSAGLGGYTQVGGFGVFDSTQLFVPWMGIAGLVVGLPVVIALVTVIAVRSAPTAPPRRAT